VRQILYPPPAGETSTNPISPQRYYNKADMIVVVSNTSINLTLRNDSSDPSPFTFTTGTTNWTNNNIKLWLNTNNGSSAFFDARQQANIRTVQIDVGKLGSWMSTNTNATAKWTAAGGNPFNGVLYVVDYRDTNATYMNAVRLTNGVTINTASNAMPLGLTVATPHPLYIQGNYNANTNSLNTTNVVGTAPTSVACDAFTILSSAWQDANSYSGTACNSRNAANSTTINAAILSGNVLTTGSSATTFSGGVQNFTRLLENWSSKTLTLNTSMVCLFNSAQATDQFINPTGSTSSDYYEPPSRQFFYNLNYNSSSGLPPGTPKIDRMIRASWSTLTPNTLTAPSPSLTFVPR
jgi:hypothetical protein